MLLRNRLYVRMKIVSTYFTQMDAMFSCIRKKWQQQKEEEESCLSSSDDNKSGILSLFVFYTD